MKYIMHHSIDESKPSGHILQLFMDNPDEVATAIAELKVNGWELVGSGNPRFDSLFKKYAIYDSVKDCEFAAVLFLKSDSLPGVPRIQRISEIVKPDQPIRGVAQSGYDYSPW